MTDSTPNPTSHHHSLHINNSHIITAMTKQERKSMCCNIISAMVCYMNNEYTREKLIKEIMLQTNNDTDIKTHIETIL